jgi:hypothetical protein
MRILSYLIFSFRLLPESIRVEIWFALSTLGFLLEDCDSWQEAWKAFQGWLALRRLTLTTGRVLASRQPMTYQRQWTNVHGKAPTDEILAWMRKAVNTGPGAAFSMGLYANRTRVWGNAFAKLSQFLSIQDELRAFLDQKEFEGETLLLNILPVAALGGVPLRQLPD